MHPDEFRATAHRLVDWMADYLRDVGDLPVTPDVQPGELRAALPARAPMAGEPIEAIVADFTRHIVPGMTHWGHPGFFGYFPAGSSPPSLLAEMLTATLGAQCMSWQTSPAATELEQVTLEWLRQLLGLPGDFTGVIQDTASTGTLVALITARDRCGPPHDRLTVYTSAEAHSSVVKGARLAGFRPEHVRLVPVDDAFGMRADRLEAMLAADVTAGLVPAAIVATIGTTASTGVDPVPAIAGLARRHGAWLHVDAAYAGAVAMLPECREHFAGVEHADSFLMNPHKWMGVHFDCSACYVRDVPALLRSFSATPEYLRTAHDASVVNYRDWGIPLGRRFRALKLWFVLRAFGVEGLQRMLRSHLGLAARFGEWVVQAGGWELAAPVRFGLVCFRHRPHGLADGEAVDAHNRALLARVNASRRVFLTHAVLRGRYTLRLALGHPATAEESVAEAWRLLGQAAAELAAARG